VADQTRARGHRLDGQHVEREAGQRAAVERRKRVVDINDGAPRGVHEKRSVLHHAEHLGVDHAARLIVQRSVDRHDVGLREQVGQRRALDVGREVAVDQIRIAGNDAAEHIARNVRHPLSDPAQSDDAQRHVAGAAQLARRQVVPFAGMDVAMVGDDVADRRQRERQRVRGHFADAVIGRVGDPDAVSRTGRGVDRVVSGADPADDAEVGEARHDALVIGAYCSRIPKQSRAAAITSSSVLHCATSMSMRCRPNNSRSAAMSGNSLSANRILGMGDRAPASVSGASDVVKWPTGCVFVGVSLPRPRATRLLLSVPRAVPKSRPMPLDPAPLPLFPTTIAGSLPKPAWLAEPDQLWAPWKLEGARWPTASAMPCDSRVSTRSTRASTSSPTASRRAAIS
jgi:hypothetical protein